MHLPKILNNTVTEQESWMASVPRTTLWAGSQLLLLKYCYGLAAAVNKSTTRLALPQPGCGGEWKETGRNWWVGIRAV